MDTKCNIPNCENLAEISIQEESGIVEVCHACFQNPRVTPQPPPLRNDLPAVWDLVQADMKARDQEGRRKYSVPLQPHNGRDALIDLYQELLDAVAYTRQLIYERDGK